MRMAGILVLALAAVAGCATLSQVAALRKVDFNLDRVSAATLAGVRLEGKQSYSDLNTTELARLAAAVATKNVPLVMTVHVQAENPATNSVSARLVQLDWTLNIEDQPTVSGRLAQEYELPPGQVTDVPLAVEVDLWDFFSGRAQDLFGLALSAAGRPKCLSSRPRVARFIAATATRARAPTVPAEVAADDDKL